MSKQDKFYRRERAFLVKNLRADRKKLDNLSKQRVTPATFSNTESLRKSIKHQEERLMNTTKAIKYRY